MSNKSNTLKYFMWGYQPHFRISLGVNSKDLFANLSPKLIPEVFLIGKLADKDPSSHPICLEPEDVFDISIFKDLDTVISDIAKADPDRNILHSHPIAAENHKKRMNKRWIREGIIKILSGADNEGTFFGSFPKRVNNYEVVVVLRFEKEFFESFYSLKIDMIDDRYKISRSFIESCITEFLNAAADVLDKDDPGAIGGIGKPTDELMRSSAKSFMLTPAWYGGSFEGLHGLYDAANAISLSRYEGSEAVGCILVSRQDHPSIETLVRFLKPAKLNRARSVRKLLETSSESLALLTDSHVVYGLGVQKNNYDASKEDLYEIKFTKRHAWSVLHANNIIMTIEDGLPQLPKEKISTEKILSDLKRLFPVNSEDQNKKIYSLIERAARQKHGTMLVITKNAEEEARRLENQSTRIDPIKLDTKLIDNLTTIDGAILLTPTGVCHAIGVVLDGKATPKGDSARGARYNSAIRYIDGSSDSLAVVISEDGTVDLFPNLRPQFPRLDIDQVIVEARNILAAKDPDLGDASQIVNWFEKASFYLRDEDCVVANQLIELIDKAPYEVGQIRIVHKQFKKHEEMNESYYL